LFDLAQGWNAAIRRQRTAIKFDRDGRLPETDDRPRSGSVGSFMAAVASLKLRESACTTNFYAKSNI
jgi:hypothetical protein